MTNRESRSRPRNAPSSVVHEHGWRVESRHTTSIGEVSYVRCGECGARRVDVHEPGQLSPVALSTELHRAYDPDAS